MVPLKEPRILFLTNSPSGGGAERATNILVNALHNSNTVVALATINASQLDSVKVLCESFYINRRWRGGLVSVIVAFIKFRNILHTWKPDIVVFVCELPELFASISSGNYRKVIVLQSSNPWTTRVKLGKIIRARLVRQGVTWVSVSNHFKVWNKNFLPNAVIPNPIVSNTKNDIRSNLEPTRIRRLLYIGRLSEEKQPEWVLEVARQIDLPSLFIGNGTMLAQLKIISATAGITAQFYGYATDPWCLVREGDVLIVPSKFEGDGLVILEAISRGVPILMNDISDLRRFSLPDDFYCTSPIEFAEAIKAKIENANNFVVPYALADGLLNERNPEYVAESWKDFLLQIDCAPKIS